MNHILIQSSDRAACSCGHWWTKVWIRDSPEVATLHQRHADAWAAWTNPKSKAPTAEW